MIDINEVTDTVLRLSLLIVLAPESNFDKFIFFVTKDLLKF
jgi:hypothetical protein